MRNGISRALVWTAIGLAASAAQAGSTPYGLRVFEFEAGFAPGLPPPADSPIQFSDHYNNDDPLTGATKLIGGVSSPAAMSYTNAGFSPGVETLPADAVAAAYGVGRLQLRPQDAVDTGPNNLSVPGLTIFTNRLTVADVAGSPLLSRTQSFEVRSFWDFVVPDANSFYGQRLSDNPGGGADYNDLLDMRATLGGDGLPKLQLRRLSSTGGLLTNTPLMTVDVQSVMGSVGKSLSDLALVGFGLHYNYFGDGNPGNGVQAKFEFFDADGNDLAARTWAGAPIALFQGEDFTRPSVSAVWQLAPVPEPATWALMLGGLLGVGALARRRGAQPKA